MDAHGHTVTGGPEPRPPAHADRPWPPAQRLTGYAAGGLAALCIAVATALWLDSQSPARSTPTSANLITVTPSAGTSGTSR